MHTVEITFVELSADVTNDVDGEQFPHVVEEALASCSTATKMIEARQSRIGCLCRDKPLPVCSDVKKRLSIGVQKYLKVPDKYMALTSILFKSQAFYQTYAHDSACDLPVVELPRTPCGKPFIPTQGEEDEGDLYPLSISHQFPFCSVARLVNESGDNHNRKLGMDIVVFESFNTRLYNSVEDFINVFRDSFTEWEWQRIHLNEDDILIEFYLRWAMKEAYTKALGDGMYLDFKSFQTRLSVVDDSGDKGIWTAVSHVKDGMHLRGSVIRDLEEEHREMVSDWEFYFLPLESNGEAAGCACVCFGPLQGDCIGVPVFEERQTWTTIRSLIRYHHDVN